MADVDVAAERAGEADLVDGVDSQVVHQQPGAGVERGLRELDRPDVALGDRDARRAVVEDVGERPAVGDDPRRPAGKAPSTTPSAVTTPARNSSATASMIPEPQMPVIPTPAEASAKPGSSDQSVAADDPEPRLERDRVDPHPLDGARRGALPGADLGALERRAGGARRGEEPVPVAEHELRVGADVHDQPDGVRQVRLVGEDDARRVGADVARDARQDVDARAGMRAVSPSPRAVVVTARSVASVNGAEPSGVGVQAEDAGGA